MTFKVVMRFWYQKSCWDGCCSDATTHRRQEEKTRHHNISSTFSVVTCWPKTRGHFEVMLISEFVSVRYREREAAEWLPPPCVSFHQAGTCAGLPQVAKPLPPLWNHRQHPTSPTSSQRNMRLLWSLFSAKTISSWFVIPSVWQLLRN